ncbi:MAG: ornithine cyclodeaminase family protein [Alphaproteobacteria bacterium]
MLTPRVCLDALEAAYRALGEDPESEPKTLGFKANQGSFHIKAGVYPKTRQIFAAKLNANFPGNPKDGLPTIQGLVILVDGTNGIPLAVMDSGELTAIRTAAATALAAKFGARAESRAITLIGTGYQAGYILEALKPLFPIDRIFAYDLDKNRAAKFAKTFGAKAVSELTGATLQSDIIVTCTTSKTPVLLKQQVGPGTFISAVGADNSEKQELDPELFKGAGVLVDDLEKCALEAELHHALDAGVITRADVRADLCQLASGQKKGRENDQEIVIFDSLGTGLQDVAAAEAAYLAYKSP